MGKNASKYFRGGNDRHNDERFRDGDLQRRYVGDLAALNNRSLRVPRSTTQVLRSDCTTLVILFGLGFVGFRA